MNDSLKVLVVEDTDSYARVLTLALEARGLKVDTCINGQEALSALIESQPDLIVSDVMMPVMDGLEFVRRLRASPVTMHTPVLMLSALTGRDRVQASLIAGANQYVSKDTPISQVADRVMAMLDAVPDRPHTPVQTMANTVTVLGAKGGSGKTSVAINVGAALAARKGETAVLVDLNLEFSTAAMMLDLKAGQDLQDMLSANQSNVTDAEFDRFLLHHPSGLRLLPPIRRTGESELIRDDALASVVGRLRRLYHHVVIDARPSFRNFMIDIWEMSDTILVTCPPDVVSVGVTQSLLRAFASVEVSEEKLIVVVDQVSSNGKLTDKQVERTLGLRARRVPFGGEKFQDCVDLGRVYVDQHPTEPAARALLQLADELAVRARDRRSAASANA